MLNRKQSEILTGQGSYAVILLVLLLGSLKIAKFSGVSVHCNFSSFFFQLCTYTTFEYLVRILFHVTVYVNVTILRKGSHYFHVVSCPLSHDPRGGGAARCRVKAAVRHTASPHKVSVTF